MLPTYLQSEQGPCKSQLASPMQECIIAAERIVETFDRMEMFSTTSI